MDEVFRPPENIRMNTRIRNKNEPAIWSRIPEFFFCKKKKKKNEYFQT